MKVMKVTAVLCALLLVSSAAFASGENTATAFTLSNDADNYMDVNNWQTVKIQNLFTAMQLENSTLNFGAAKYFGKNYFGVSYEGNLWTNDASFNDLNVLFGMRDMGFKAGFSWDTDSAENTVTIRPSLEWGYNFKAGKMPAALDVYGSLDFVNTHVSETTTPVTGTTVTSTTSSTACAPVIGADLQLTLSQKDPLSQYVKFGYKGWFGNSASGTTTVDTTIAGTTKTSSSSFSGSATAQYNTIYAQYSLTAKLDPNFTYGGRIRVPFMFYTDSSDSDNNSTTITFAVDNGIQGYIVPKKFALDAGLATLLPAIYFEKDNNHTDSLSNTLYLGFTWNLAPTFTVEAANEFVHTNVGTGTTHTSVEPSISDFWNEQFTISAMARF